MRESATRQKLWEKTRWASLSDVQEPAIYSETEFRENVMKVIETLNEQHQQRDEDRWQMLRKLHEDSICDLKEQHEQEIEKLRKTEPAVLVNNICSVCREENDAVDLEDGLYAYEFAERNRERVLENGLFRSDMVLAEVPLEMVDVGLANYTYLFADVVIWLVNSGMNFGSTQYQETWDQMLRIWMEHFNGKRWADDYTATVKALADRILHL